MDYKTEQENNAFSWIPRFAGQCRGLLTASVLLAILGSVCDSRLKNFSIAFQNIYLFKDTVENNIKFGCPEATHE